MEDEIETYMEEFDALLTEMKHLKYKKTKDYGLECERSLGAKGLFVDMNGKFYRLKHFIWDKPDDIPLVLDEKIKDTLLDLAIYCLMSILAIKHKKGGE